jgi:hypothetical protein
MKDYKSYLATSDNFMKKLDKYGVCVIPNILLEDECIKIRNKMWDEIKYICKNRFDINNIDTWNNFYDLMPLHSMLIQYHNIAHLQSVWDIRQHENIGNIFSKIWNVPKEELLTSFDGISINLPPEKTKRGWFLGNDWMHTDQSSNKKGLQSIQGFVNLYPVNQGDATLTILEKSHKYHEEFFNHINIHDNNDWFKLNTEQKQWFINKGCNQFCVIAPIGSLVLWDSRTIHQGIEAQKDRLQENFRMVVYTCLFPKDNFSKKIKEKRKKYFQDMRVTSHWGTKIFPKNLRTYGRELKEFNKPNPPVLTEYGKLLI